MDESDGEKRVLRFGDPKDIIFCRKASLQSLQNEINALYNEWAEYDPESTAPKDDPFIKELEGKIVLLEAEQKLIQLDIKAFEDEMAIIKFSHNNPI